MTKRDTLANIAEVEAMKNFHGFNENNISNLHPIISLFSKWSLEDADFSWCAAFVYYCCKLAE